MMMAALGSCVFQEHENTASSRHDNLERNDQDDVGSRIPYTSGLYLTVVDFPDDYDWQRDTARGCGTATVRMLRDGEEIFAMETGLQAEISTDPDKLHFVGGRIYSEFYNGTATVYKCNGREVLRVPGREMIKGLASFDTHLFALCQSLDGGGLTLRKDWKDVFHDNEGNAHGGMEEYAMGKAGALYEDNGSLCFNYSRGKGEPGRGQEWFIVIDGQEQRMELPSGVARIYDTRRFNGITRLIAKGVDGRAPYYYEGSTRYDLANKIPGVPEVYDYRLYRYGGDIRFYGTFLGLKSQPGMTGYWNTSRILELRECDCKIFKDDIHVFRYKGMVQAICYGSRRTETGTECRIISPQCVEWTSGGGACIAMTQDRHPREPLLWHDGIMDTLRFNGYICSVNVVEDD